MFRSGSLGAPTIYSWTGWRGSTPAKYEQRLADIFKEIITSPESRLVQ